MFGQQRRLSIAWLILCAVTLASAALSENSSGADDAVPLVGIAVLGFAFAKVHVVMNYFMELDHAPKAWRYVFLAWVIAVFVGLSGLLMI